MSLYVTDYTFNEGVYYDNERHRRPGIQIPGMVTEICLWDDCAVEAHGQLRVGMHLAMNNVQIKVGPHGIQGALRSAYKVRTQEIKKGQGWRILSENDPAVVTMMR
jgi:hypothetical protein